jgi:hypothetical protein
MSVGSNLQEMENVVTKGAAPADPMPTSGVGYEDLGGPTPFNYRPDDDSAKFKDAAATLAQVKDVVNAKASKAVAKEEVEEDENLEVVSEDSAEDSVDEIEDSEEIVEEEEITEGEEISEEETEEELDIEEDVKALLEGEDLSEEFQEKARTIFEAAIRSKVSEIKEELQSTYENALIEEVQIIKNELTERVDSYLEYVSDEWIHENQLAIEKGLKSEMTESFLQGMKQLFEDHYVTIPEDRYDVLESMVDKLDEMEEKLNEQIEKNVALNRRLAESVADVIFADVSEGLALSQRDKLASLAENVEFDSEANYREKLVTLRESYFPSNTGTQKEFTENLSEEVIHTSSDNSDISPAMESYLRVLGKTSNK